MTLEQERHAMSRLRGHLRDVVVGHRDGFQVLAVVALIHVALLEGHCVCGYR